MKDLHPIFKRPIFLGSVVFVSLTILTQYLAYQRYLISQDAERQKVIREANSVKDRLKTSLSYCLSATKTLAYLVAEYGIPRDFNSIAKEIVESNRYIDALELTRKGVITLVYPTEGNQTVIGFDVLGDSLTDKEAFKAIEKKELFFAGPLMLRQGGIAVVGRLPIFIEDHFFGFSVVLIKLSTLLKAAGIDTLRNKDFLYQLSKVSPLTQKEEFFLSPVIPHDAGQLVSIDVPDGEWKLYVMPKVNQPLWFHAITFSLLGLFLSINGGVFAWFLARQPEKLHQLVEEKTLQLAASEKYFRSLIEKSSDAIVLLDSAGKVGYQSPSTERISGYSLREIQRLNGLELIHPDDREGDAAMFAQLVQSPGNTLHRNHRLKHKNGHYIWLEGTYTNLLNDENVKAIVYNYHDVTLRVESEEKATVANRLYEVISRINQVIVHVTDEQTLFREACRIAVDLGKFRMAWVGMIDEIERKVIPVMYAGEERAYLSTIKSVTLDNPILGNGPTGRAIRSGAYVFCNDIENDPIMKPWAAEALARGYRSSISLPIKKFGKVVGTFTLYASVPHYFNAKEIALLEETTGDVSFTLENFERENLRKQAEEEVLKVYKEKETTLNRISDSVASVDNEWHYTFLNESALATHPDGRQGTIGKVIWDVHPEMKGTVFWDKYREAMRTRKVAEIESYYAPMDTWFSVKVYPAADGLTIFYRDITERKKAEDQIAAEKVFSASIINSLPGVFYLYDRKGKFRRWNKNFETVSGYHDQEITRMHPLDFFLPDEKPLLQDAIDKVFTTGSADITAHFYTKSKKKIPYCFNGRQVNFSGTDYLIGMGIDVSERITAENELRERTEEIQKLTAHLQYVREEERTGIAREIHDELGQQLTGLKMDASWIGKRITGEDKAIQEKLSTMVSLIDDTVKTVRRISSELRPGILDDLGLIPALEWQTQEFEKRTGIRSQFLSQHVDLDPERNLSINIFRIYQEALTNVARHAQATQVETTLEEKEGNVRLTIQDNGVGFDLEEVKNKNSLGLIGMRERALLFQGELTIESKKRKGTVISLKVPLLKTDKSLMS